MYSNHVSGLFLAQNSGSLDDKFGFLLAMVIKMCPFFSSETENTSCSYGSSIIMGPLREVPVAIISWGN